MGKWLDNQGKKRMLFRALPPTLPLSGRVASADRLNISLFRGVSRALLNGWSTTWVQTGKIYSENGVYAII